MDYTFTFAVASQDKHVEVIGTDLHSAAEKCRQEFGEEISLSSVVPNDTTRVNSFETT